MKTTNIFTQVAMLVLGIFLSSVMLGNGLSPEGNSNEKERKSANKGTEQRTEQVAISSLESIGLMVEGMNSGGKVFNFPDPFYHMTAIVYALDKPTWVSLRVYKETKLVAELVNDHMMPGTYTAVWDAEGEPSGYYIAMLITQDGTFLDSMFKKSATISTKEILIGD
jgi:hypothetical protein